LTIGFWLAFLIKSLLIISRGFLFFEVSLSGRFSLSPALESSLEPTFLGPMGVLTILSLLSELSFAYLAETRILG
jgi:hypothetical protein